MIDQPEPRQRPRASRQALDRRSVVVGGTAGALVAALVLGSGVVLSPVGASAQLASNPPIVTAAAAAPGTIAAVAETAGPAVVSVRTDQGLGSGVIYDPS